MWKDGGKPLRRGLGCSDPYTNFLAARANDVARDEHISVWSQRTRLNSRCAWEALSSARMEAAEKQRESAHGHLDSAQDLAARRVKLKRLMDGDLQRWLVSIEARKREAQTNARSVERLRERGAAIDMVRETKRNDASRTALERRAVEDFDELRPYQAQARLEALVLQWDQDIAQKRAHDAAAKQAAEMFQEMWSARVQVPFPSTPTGSEHADLRASAAKQQERKVGDN